MRFTVKRTFCLLVVVLILGCDSEERRKRRAEDERDAREWREKIKREEDQKIEAATRKREDEENQKKKMEEARLRKREDEENQKKKMDEARLRRLQEIIKEAAAVYNPILQNVPPPSDLKGKALLLDVKAKRDYLDRGDLPKKIRGKHDDPELILFLVSEQWISQSAQTLYTKIAGSEIGNAVSVPRFQHQLDVSIVAWPSKKALGTFQLKGNVPNVTFAVVDREGKLIGEPGRGEKVSLANWVQNRFAK